MSVSHLHRLDGNIVWIKLTRGQETCVDLVDWPTVAGYKWYASRRKEHSTFYAATSFRRPKKGNFHLHRLLLNAERVDHKDLNGLNNRRGNLRPCTHAQNLANVAKSINNSSGFKGVTWDKATQKWRASIMVNWRYISLGRFLDLEEAARAYDAAALSYYGEFARLNFP